MERLVQIVLGKLSTKLVMLEDDLEKIVAKDGISIDEKSCGVITILDKIVSVEMQINKWQQMIENNNNNNNNNKQKN